MFDFTAKDWVNHLESWYSFEEDLWSQNPCDSYYRAMKTFQVFTNRIIAVLRYENDTSRALMQDEQLHKIYDSLPDFRERLNFHKWVKSGTMKHPQRRTAKQFQWLLIVDLQEAMPTGDIVQMVERAVLSLEEWANLAHNVDNLCVDPIDKEYFFRNKHAVKDAPGNQSESGESCWICANDFDKNVHRPQQGPCGHIYCHECFEKTLVQALWLTEAKYTCAFCRSCLVCGVSSCKDHVTPHEQAHPFPLGPHLHLLCNKPHGPCVSKVKLYGISPKRYWAFREQSRDLRSDLAVQFRMLELAVDPVHRAQAKEEADEYLEKLKKMAVQAHKLSQEDLKVNQTACALDALGI